MLSYPVYPMLRMDQMENRKRMEKLNENGDSSEELWSDRLHFDDYGYRLLEEVAIKTAIDRAISTGTNRSNCDR